MALSSAVQRVSAMNSAAECCNCRVTTKVLPTVNDNKKADKKVKISFLLIYDVACAQMRVSLYLVRSVDGQLVKTANTKFTVNCWKFDSIFKDLVRRLLFCNAGLFFFTVIVFRFLLNMSKYGGKCLYRFLNELSDKYYLKITNIYFMLYICKTYV